MNIQVANQDSNNATCDHGQVQYHERIQYTTLRGTVWTLPRTVTISEGTYRLEFVFDDEEEKLALVTGGRLTHLGDEVIVYSYSFKDYSRFDMRGRLIS